MTNDLTLKEVSQVINAMVFHIEAIEDSEVEEEDKLVHAQALIEINESVPDDYKFDKLAHTLKEKGIEVNENSC